MTVARAHNYRRFKCGCLHAAAVVVEREQNGRAWVASAIRLAPHGEHDPRVPHPPRPVVRAWASDRWPSRA